MFWAPRQASEPGCHGESPANVQTQPSKRNKTQDNFVPRSSKVIWLWLDSMLFTDLMDSQTNDQTAEPDNRVKGKHNKNILKINFNWFYKPSNHILYPSDSRKILNNLASFYSLMDIIRFSNIFEVLERIPSLFFTMDNHILYNFFT